MNVHYATLYRIQDGIYKHRKTASKIPDYLYNYMRSSQEDKVHMMVNKLSQQ